MTQPSLDKLFWQKRLEQCAVALDKNGFDVFIADTLTQASQRALQWIETAAPTSIAYGDSMTMRDTGILECVRNDSRWEFIDGFNPSMTRPEKMRLRRKALGADLFMTGVNAITTQGVLVWLDMIGNRIAPICFGPLDVILFVGRNKISDTTEAARNRIRTIAAPMNAIRHTGMKTPCITTGRCHDCQSDDRICNAWLEVVKCYPKKRIKVILINQDLGL